MKTDVENFKLFHKLLMKNAPEDYTPFYFTLKKNSKDPLSFYSWKKERKSFEDSCKYMDMGYNIGIAATTEDKLIIIDVDDMDKVPLSTVKRSLMDISRKRIGRHFYYFTEEPPSYNYTDFTCKKNLNPGDDAGEIRAVWNYVVAPGSFVPCTEEEIKLIPEEDKKNAGKYTVEIKTPACFLIFNELPLYFKLHYCEKARLQKKQTEKKPKQKNETRKRESAIFGINIKDVVPGKSASRFASPFHSSKTGKDTSFSEDGNLLHCWRCDVYHNGLTAMAVMAGVGSCKDCGYEHGSGFCSIDYSDGETLLKIWIYAKENGIIPRNDTPPSAAVKQFCLDREYITKKDIFDGWKIDREIYLKAVQIMKGL